MARYKDHNQDQGEFIVVQFSEQLLMDTFEYTLNHLINEKIDLSALDS